MIINRCLWGFPNVSFKSSLIVSNARVHMALLPVSAVVHFLMMCLNFVEKSVFEQTLGVAQFCISRSRLCRTYIWGSVTRNDQKEREGNPKWTRLRSEDGTGVRGGSVATENMDSSGQFLFITNVMWTLVTALVMNTEEESEESRWTEGNTLWSSRESQTKATNITGT